MSNNIHDLLEGGIIVAHDRELDLVVVANGAYLNLYHGDREGNYHAADAFARGSGNDPDKSLYNTTAADLMDEGEELLEDLKKEMREEEP